MGLTTINKAEHNVEKLLQELLTASPSDIIPSLSCTFPQPLTLLNYCFFSVFILLADFIVQLTTSNPHHTIKQLSEFSQISATFYTSGLYNASSKASQDCFQSTTSRIILLR
ncbi:3-hydroxy-3-methylglutaryl coenzyme A reductase [Trichinella pseudospiralis]